MWTEWPALLTASGFNLPIPAPRFKLTLPEQANLEEEEEKS